MATKPVKTPKTTKTPKSKKVIGEPIVTVGSHSTRTQYANGKVEFVVDDEKLRMDVLSVLESIALGK
jgi:hypothetical protein